jgi:hypothetical protein
MSPQEASKAAILMSMLERRGHMIISKVDKGTLTPCSPRAKSSAHSTSISPASPNNDLIAHKIIEANSSAPSEKNPGEDKLPFEAVEKLG